MTAPIWLPAYQRRAATQSDLGHNLHVLFGAAAKYPACKIVEIGVNSGQSTTAFLAAAELVGGHVWSVDIDPDCRFAAEYAREGSRGPWTFILGDSAQQATVDQTPDDADLLFIDSSHTYAQTRAELENYLPRIRPGGTVLMHDTDLPTQGEEVRAALDEILPGFGLTWRECGGENGLGLIQIPDGD
jgi:predicted O-methyltransferase YrrM